MDTILCYMRNKTNIIKTMKDVLPQNSHFIQNYNYPSRNTEFKL